jgi:hypothetical protein
MCSGCAAAEGAGLLRLRGGRKGVTAKHTAKEIAAKQVNRDAQKGYHLTPKHFPHEKFVDVLRPEEYDDHGCGMQLFYALSLPLL